MTDEPQGPLLLGVDGGTEGVRVGLFDAGGTALAVSRRPYPTRFPRAGWAEQKPEHWWLGLSLSVQEVLASSGVDPARITGIATAATSFTMVCVGEDDKPLRPALMWMDSRASAEAEQIGATGSPALRYTGGNRASAEWMLGKAMWLRRHEPATYEATTWFADYAEYIAFQLTGERAASEDSAAIRCYYDSLRGGWPVDLWDAVGLPELREKVPQRVVPMGEVVGHLTPAVAAELGLPAGIPVASGGADAFVAMLGLGVTGPGSLAMVTGSSHVHMLQTPVPRYTEGLFGSYTDAVLPGQFTIEGGQITTGAMVAWYVRSLAGEQAGPEAMTALYRRLNEEAAALPPGSEGVVALDYLQGNRTPHIDPNARGMLWGLSLSHGPHHIYRALVESVCYGTEAIIRSMRAAGNAVEEIVACGGALNSPLWMQVHADVAGLPIRTTAQPDVAVLGAAVLAAAGAGLYSSTAEAASAMVRPGRVIEPSPSATQAYRPWVELYLDSYTAMRPLLHRASRLAADA